MVIITAGQNALHKLHRRWPLHRRRAALWMATGTGLLLAVALICVGGASVGFEGWQAGFWVQYLIVVALVVAWMMMVGKAFTGHLEGLLIDGRNRISLSRLQLFVWLVIVGCAFAVEAGHNFHIGQWDPDKFSVPAQIGLVMGAATTSFVASPAILSLKTRSRRLYSRRNGASARWSDLFRGEESGTADSADPAKVQQFLVTFLLAVVYLATLWQQFGAQSGSHPFDALPKFSEAGLVLLGVSHAAYLGGKAAPQTLGGPPSSPGANIPQVSTAPRPPLASDKPPP